MYQNLEVRVNDLINGKQLNPKQALDALCSYAVAEEGTNTLYLGLIENLSLRDAYTVPYTVAEIEMILNYFPHGIWNEADSTATFGMQSAEANIAGTNSLRSRFYTPLLDQLESQMDILTNEQLISIF